MIIYQARFVFTVSSEPLEHGAVAVKGGRILWVGLSDDVRARYPAARVVDLGESALFPASVNAHTHLELTGLGSAIPPDLSFAEWVVALVRARRAFSFADFQRFASIGIGMLRDAGTAAVGEICTYGASVAPMVESGMRGVLYYEVLGVNPAEAPELLERAQRQIRQWQREYSGAKIRFGLSLHATYTVSARLFMLASDWCANEGVPLCIHAAESPAESAWLARHDGPIHDVLYAAAGWREDSEPIPACSPLTYLDRLGVLRARPLLAHGVQVGPGDLQLLRGTGAAVAHCPRSNAQLHCGRLPLAAYRSAGVPLALGTDSLASSPSLSIWEEAAAAHALHTSAGDLLAPDDLLRLATLDGARALGVDGVLGSLEAGKDAELAVASLAPLATEAHMTSSAVLKAWAVGLLRPKALHA